MTDNDLTLLKKWFSDYTSSFHSFNKGDDNNYKLKIEHTLNVCENIVYISKGESLSNNTILLAETIGLFHDIGRFRQFKEYKTFMDSRSVNHGLLGAETLISEKTLTLLPDNEQSLITQAVKFHNAFALPDLKGRDILLLLKLIRDADKIDIFRVFIDYYESSDDERASAAAHGLPDNSEYSKELLDSISSKKHISYSDLRTLNDFKLMHLSWAYTLNFLSSYRLLKNKNYINRIIQHLPQTEEILKTGDLVLEHLRQRVDEDRA
ncbi:MAG: HD domain-containing protein [Thermodesulfovibrionia bacterium]|nr:HD domain-containing protein [Thermodesulfovibrionia bacterium]